MQVSRQATKGVRVSASWTGGVVESAGRQKIVVLDLQDGELQVVAESLRPCARRGGNRGVARSRGVAAVVCRSNKGQLQEQRVM